MYREEFEKAVFRTLMGIMLVFIGFIVLSMGLFIYFINTIAPAHQANWTGTVIIFPFIIIHTDNPWLPIFVLLLFFLLFFIIIHLFFKSVSKNTGIQRYP